MLILSRKLSESIVIDGRITVTVMRVDGDVVKLGVRRDSELIEISVKLRELQD